MNSVKVNSILAFALIFWASAFVFIRVGLTGYSPGSLALLRFAIASLCMGLIYLQVPAHKKLSWPNRWLAMLVGAIGIGIYNTCLNYGETEVSAGVASFVLGLAPVITLLVSVALFSERINKKAIGGMVLSFSGLLLIAWGEQAHASLITLLALLGAALVSAIYVLSQKRLLAKLHPVAVTTWIIWGGTMSLLFFTPTAVHELQTAPLKASMAVIYLGIFPAALAYLAWTYVLEHMPASKASIYLYTLPILATSMGFIFLQEQPSKLSLLGGMMALCGAMITNYYRRPSRHPERSEGPPVDGNALLKIVPMKGDHSLRSR